MRLDAARTRSTPNGSLESVCWNSIPRFIVINASYSPRMRRRSSPFVMPAQRRPMTVSTLWPWSAAARSSGSCSSRRTRTSYQRSARDGERRDRLVTSRGWELAKELVQGFAAFEVIKQGLHRDACADEHRRAVENIWVASHDLA